MFGWTSPVMYFGVGILLVLGVLALALRAIRVSARAGGGGFRYHIPPGAKQPGRETHWMYEEPEKEEPRQAA